jgi:hypothetical protein
MGLIGKDSIIDQYGQKITNYYVGIHKGHVHIHKFGDTYHFECDFGLWITEDMRWNGYDPIKINTVSARITGDIPTIKDIYQMLYDKYTLNWISKFEDVLVNRQINSDTTNL